MDRGWKILPLVVCHQWGFVTCPKGHRNIYVFKIIGKQKSLSIPKNWRHVFACWLPISCTDNSLHNRFHLMEVCDPLRDFWLIEVMVKFLLILVMVALSVMAMPSSEARAPAVSCDITKFKLPICKVFDVDIPGGLSRTDTPQVSQPCFYFILLSF